MSHPNVEKSERLARRTDYMRARIESSIRARWGEREWELLFPWWRAPVKVRILMYADGRVNFSNGLYGGLQHVITLLKSRVYFYVDFDITTAHRDGDQSATIKEAVRLTDPELNILEKFDEIWFFGEREEPSLTKEERCLLDTFMAAPDPHDNDNKGVLGGVLVTGDHANIGKGLAGEITRAGEMRRYPAPGGSVKEANNTLEEGPDENKTFDPHDQSDDRPQKIRYIPFPVGSPLGFKRRVSPHPLLCGPDGPIDVLPDHQHEGEAVAPTIKKGDRKWPTNEDEYQELPYVIARGIIKDPASAGHGQEIGLVSAYNGHNVDVGRIIADSSWHHWFDFNLTGTFPKPPYAGFDATPDGQASLKKIEAYFLNCAVWLAPPRLQAEMRNAVWWSILWTDQFAELPPDAPLWHLGEEAISALKLRLPSCVVTDWVLDTPAFKAEIPHAQLQQAYERFSLFNLAIEQYVAGGIISQLMWEVGPFNPDLPFPDSAPSDEKIQSAIKAGTCNGVSALRKQLSEDATLLLNLLQSNFRMQLSPEEQPLPCDGEEPNEQA